MGHDPEQRLVPLDKTIARGVTDKIINHILDHWEFTPEGKWQLSRRAQHSLSNPFKFIIELPTPAGNLQKVLVESGEVEPGQVADIGGSAIRYGNSAKIQIVYNIGEILDIEGMPYQSLGDWYMIGKNGEGLSDEEFNTVRDMLGYRLYSQVLHELTHAIDPGVKPGEAPGDDLEEYYSYPAEVEAYVQQIINDLSRLDKQGRLPDNLDEALKYTVWPYVSSYMDDKAYFHARTLLENWYDKDRVRETHLLPEERTYEAVEPIGNKPV